MSVPPHHPHADPPPGPAGTLVLRGAAHGLHRAKRWQLIISVILTVFDLGCVALIVVLAVHQLHVDERLHIQEAQARANFDTQLLYLPVFAILLTTPATIFTQWAVLRRRERPLADTELWLSPDAVTYTCRLGSFTAPKTAVRWITFAGRPGPRDELRIDVENWGGPLLRLGYRQRPQALFMPLSGADRRSIAQTVYAATGGQAVLRAG